MSPYKSPYSDVLFLRGKKRESLHTFGAGPSHGHLLVVALVVSLASVTAASQNARGSLVIAVVSPKGEYVVLAADSRNTNGYDHKPANDDACKLIGLSKKILFFETGESEYRSNRGDLWDARAVARRVYLQSRSHNVHSLSLAWTAAARKWFSALPKNEMHYVTAPDGTRGNTAKIVTGGFVALDADGLAIIDAQNLYYSFADGRFTVSPEFSSPGPGQVAASGLGLDLVREFTDILSTRASMARRLDFFGVNAKEDSRVAADAIRFVEEYAAPATRNQIGGPIDIAILRKGGTTEWVARKSECYRDDLVQPMQ